MVHNALRETTPLLRSFGRNATPSNIIGVRHIQALLMFFGICFGYFLRVNISAAIVPMSQTKNLNGYNWDTSIKSLILSSFFWGYVLAQIPASMMAKRFGGKLVLGYATLLGSIITLLHPVATHYGDWELLCVLRMVVGFMQGTVYPCLHTLLAKWAPSTERGVLSSVVYSGAQFGTATLLSVSGSIFDSKWGWPGLFYISGCISLIWAIVFLLFGADSPRESGFISVNERKYIEGLTGSTRENGIMPVPWTSIFTSLPFLALVAAHCGFTWGFYTLLTQMPTYMYHVLDLNFKANAILSALPYFVMWLLCLVVSPIADLLINRKILGVTSSRKIFNSIGQLIPMACLIALGYMTKDTKSSAIVLLTVAVGFNAASFCGYLVNHMDLSPNFAGPLMGISNCISNLLSLCAPLIVGVIVHNEKDPYEWRIVFLTTAVMYLICNTLFVIFGKATVQAWNDSTTNSTILLAAHSMQLPTTGVPNEGNIRAIKVEL